MRTPSLSGEQIAELLGRAGLVAADWDLAEIGRRANAWIADYHAELTDPEVRSWSVEVQAAHYAEFGSLAAVDFFEQCVAEDAPPTAPWQQLWARVDDGEFDAWPPVWQAATP